MSVLAAPRAAAWRLRAFGGALWFAWRLRVRAIASGGRVTVRWGGPGTRIKRGVRLSVLRGARASVYVGGEVTIERGTRLVLGDGTLYLGERVAAGPRGVLEARDGGALVLLAGATLGQGCVLRAAGRDVEVRPDAALEDYVMTGDGHGTIRIGREAVVGTRTVLCGGADVADGTEVAPHTAVAGRLGDAARPRDLRAAAPEASVVISTRNRAALLPRAFAALERQQLPPGRFELVVVDDGSTDDTPDVLEALSAEAPFDVRVIRRDRSGGPAAGRNAGWRAARGAVIAFTDDDCTPAPEWLAAGLAAMRSEADLVQGRTLPEPSQEARGGMFTLTNRVTREGGHYETCNMFYRRDVLEALGGFDERFPYPMAEDTDLAWRALEDGCRSRFEPAALLFHDVRDVGVRGLMRRGRHLASHALLVEKHPSVRRIYYRPWVMKRSHLLLPLAVAAAVAGFVWTPWAWLGAAPYVLEHLLNPELPVAPLRRLLALPAFAVIDAVEMASLAAAGVRHGRFLL